MEGTEQLLLDRERRIINIAFCVLISMLKLIISSIFIYFLKKNTSTI